MSGKPAAHISRLLDTESVLRVYTSRGTDVEAPFRHAATIKGKLEATEAVL